MAETKMIGTTRYMRGEDGRWYKDRQAPPRDPGFDYIEPKAAAEVANTRTNTQGTAIDNEFDQRTMGDRVSAEEYKALAAKYEALQKQREFESPAQIGEEQRREALKAWAAANEIDNTIPGIERAYQAGPGATRGMMGIRDFLPTQENQSFDKASNRLRAPLKAVLGFTGGENNAVAESQVNMGPFIPSSWDFDGTNRKTIASARQKGQEARTRAAMQLGGMPDSNGRVTPLPSGYRMGQYPDLDREVASRIDRVPLQKRPGYMLDARRRYLQALKKAPRKSAFEFLGFED